MATVPRHNPGTGRTPPHVLRVDASGRYSGSVSRQLTDTLIETLRDHYGQIRVTTRDLATGLPFVDEVWIGANFTPAEDRSGVQREALARSDALVRELAAADVVVIGVPIYNFGVPAALKAWIDLVARVRLTFRYTENGPVGLLEAKRAYLVITSGGTPVGSDIDFATGYLRHVLGFLGITDVHLIGADRLGARADAAVEDARAEIAALGSALPTAGPSRHAPEPRGRNRSMSETR